MTADTLPPAPQNEPRIPWYRRLILLPLAIAFAYALYVGVQEWIPPSRPHELRNTQPVLQALLFRRGAGIHVYDLSTPKLVVRTAGERIRAPEGTEPVRLLSTRAALIRSEDRFRVRDAASSYAYDPLTADDTSPLALLSRATNFTFSLSDDSQQPHLNISFAPCGFLAAIPLPEAQNWYSSDQLFDTLSLPKQSRMLLSPAETALTIVHHELFPQIMLADLLQRSAAALFVPSFGTEQVHFSPFFVDERTLLFSVLDSNRHATVLYDISEGTYDIISPDFTDHAYHSFTGKVILRQSFFDDSVNIPFGSVALLEKQRGLPVESIEEITGPRADNASLFALLFVQPEDPVLHFSPDLDLQSFNGIASSAPREALRALWQEYQLKLMHATGEFRLSTLGPDRTLVRSATIPFALNPPAVFVEYVENVEPLLRALDVPDAVIEEYRTRSATVAGQGDYYLLVDELSY